MVPNFLLPIYQPTRKTELELLCSYVDPNDWDRIETNIWKMLLTEAQPVLNLNPELIPYFMTYYETGDDTEITKKIPTLARHMPIKHRSLLSALVYKSFDDLSGAIYRLQLDAIDGAPIDEYQKNSYHYIVKEIINIHEEQDLPYSTPYLSKQILDIVRACHQVATNSWRIDYNVVSRDMKIGYTNMKVSFKTEADLVLFTLAV